jgi:predicted house-cleaning noncanonical NTP pyrophosphatase (MazG superfamily)
MKTYKELKDALFEEVGKIDISDFNLGMLASYTELLEKMSKLPNMAVEELMVHSLLKAACCVTEPPIPKTEKG